MHVKVLILVASFALFASPLAAWEVTDFRKLTDHISREDYPGIEVRMRVEVVYAGKFADGMYVVTSADNVNYRGLLMSAPQGTNLKEGDVIDITGGMTVVKGNSAIRADTVNKVTSRVLPAAPMHKFVDFRNGKLHARRAAFIGWIDPDTVYYAPDGSFTLIHLTIWRSYMIVRVPGRLNVKKYEGAPVHVTGVGMNHYDLESGEIKDIFLEVSGKDALVSLREDKWKTPLLVCASSVAAIALVVLWFVWAKARREKIANAAIARDRRRLAAELHDTIEQHLATAKLYATGALRVPGLPPKAEDALRRIADTLVHAKVEVRDAVMGLRGEGASGATLAERLKDLAARVSSGGAVMVRVRLVGEPPEAPPVHDIVAIVNEAVTNAIKHGHAKNIAIVADNGALRILNDGEKFDAAAVLGPETGHYGLSGMKERAARSGILLSFVNDGRWCGIELRKDEKS